MWTDVAYSSQRFREVLNAFWRRGDVDSQDLNINRRKFLVLNAFWRRGDVDRQVRRPVAPLLFCAQRLLATGRCGLCTGQEGQLSGECSTPFGDGAMWTEASRTHSRLGRVLNAFWRRGDVDSVTCAECRQ